VRRAVNFGWEDLPLRDLLHERYRLPVYLGNDAHMAALAEYSFGESRQRRNLIVIRVGQGIGAGIILNGRLFHGDGYGAGEIGHIVVAENRRRCKCGNYGCLETVASSQEIIRRAQALAAEDGTSLLHHSVAGGAAIDLDAVVQAFEAGDAAVRALIDEVGHYLGAAVASLVGILNVERVVITGPVARFGRLLRDVIAGEVERRSLPTLAQATEIVVVEERPDAVLLGISALLLNYELVLQRNFAASFAI
jgi:predicted NBD/HSP70 family sugar kinase